MIKKSLYSVTLLLLPGIIYAKDPIPDKWQNEAELGLVMTRGNTDTQNINAKATVINETDNWKHTGKLEVLNTSDEDTTTAERYFVSGKTAHKIDEKTYEFGLLTYEADRFSGYEYRATGSIGYGFTYIKTNVQSLDLEIGAGIRQSKVEETGDTEGEGLLRGAGIFNWKVNDHATFGEELTVEAGEDSTITKSITSLKSQIAGNLATKITYTIKKSTNVPVTAKETDMELAVNLVFDF